MKNAKWKELNKRLLRDDIRLTKWFDDIVKDYLDESIRVL